MGREDEEKRKKRIEEDEDFMLDALAEINLLDGLGESVLSPHSPTYSPSLIDLFNHRTVSDIDLLVHIFLIRNPLPTIIKTSILDRRLVIRRTSDSSIKLRLSQAKPLPKAFPTPPAVTFLLAFPTSVGKPKQPRSATPTRRPSGSEEILPTRDDCQIGHQRADEECSRCVSGGTCSHVLGPGYDGGYG